MSVLLQRGSRGNNVVALQEALCEAGHELECDGIAGPDTFAALGLEITEEDDEGEQESE